MKEFKTPKERSPVHAAKVQKRRRLILRMPVVILILSAAATAAKAQWTKKADKTGLCGTQSLNTVVSGNLCYIGAGYSESCPAWYSYNPATDVWTLLSPYPGGNNSQSVGFALNGKIYAGIGQKDQTTTSCDNKLYEYTPATNTWVYKTTMPGAKRQECAAFVIGGTAYVGLGTNSSFSAKYRDFYKYDPVANDWTQIADFPDTSLTGVTCFTAAGKGYLAGGYRIGGAGANAYAYRYDPASDLWDRIAQVPSSKVFAASGAVLNDVPFICMGLGSQPGNTGRKDLYRYNIASDAWVYVDSLPDNRTWDEGIGFALNGRLYFGLGDDPTSIGLINPMMWEYNPGATGILNGADRQEAAVFPNPAHGHFQIKNAPAGRLSRVELTDVTGRCIKQWLNQEPGAVFEFGAVPPGTYFINAFSPDGTVRHCSISIN